MVSSYLIMKTLSGLKRFFCGIIILSVFFLCGYPGSCSAWYDETHIAIAKRTGYKKWFNACGADMAKLKAGTIEIYNHYVNNPPGEVITAKSVLEQVGKYNNPLDEKGHLYGAIIASVRDYVRARSEGKYGEYYLAFCAHYVGDLSMPLHNTLYDSFNEIHHQAMDATVNDEVLLHPERI
jgi:hypothetical protein